MRDIKGNVRKASNTGRNTGNQVGRLITKALENIFGFIFGTASASFEITILLRLVWFGIAIAANIAIVCLAIKWLIDTVGFIAFLAVASIIGAIIGSILTIRREHRCHTHRRRRSSKSKKRPTNTKKGVKRA